MNEFQIKNRLRIHWHWLKKEPYNKVADFVIAMGKRKKKKVDCWDCHKRKALYIHREVEHYGLCGTCFHKHNNKGLYEKE